MERMISPKLLTEAATPVELPQCWQDFYDVLDSGIDRVILWGLPGTGKTHAGLNAGVGIGGSYKITCSEEMTTADISGMFMPAKEGFSFVEGQGLRAWRGQNGVGGRLVLDEIDKASGDALSTLLNFTDTDGSSRFDHPETGENISPNKGYSVVMTTNLEDPDDLQVALRDRFPVAIEITSPHPEALKKLPEWLWQPALAMICAEPERRVSLRAFYAFQTMTEKLGVERASVLAFGKARAEGFIEAYRIAGKVK
jgi:hypothetical protein